MAHNHSPQTYLFQSRLDFAGWPVTVSFITINLWRFLYCLLKFFVLIVVDLMSTKRGFMLAHPGELFDVTSFVDGRYKTPVEEIQAALDLIRTVPVFDKNPMTAIQVLSEIGGDMSVFPSAKHLVSWAGCCPRNDQSNNKIKSTRISRAGSYFKPVLVQVANALLRSKKHPEITDRYKRIKTHPVNESKVLTTSQTLNLLKQRGYTIKDDAIPAS